MARDDIYSTLFTWLDAGHEVAMATVIATWGSSPAPVGSQLLVRDDGAMEGSVSGGCIEGAVIHAAQEIMYGSPPQVLDFGVTNEMAWEVGLACGGDVKVFVQSMAAHRPLYENTRQKVANGKSAVIAIDLTDGTREVAQGGVDVDKVLSEGRGRLSDVDDKNVFCELHAPPRRLIIVGAVHIAQALATMARITGFEVIVVDPRGAFATDARFPGVEIVSQWPDAALEQLNLDSRTAVVALTHDPKLDDPALIKALSSPAFYIGALGSRRTQARRRERLAEAGMTEVSISRIHGPIGLDIHAVTPPEIAVSILAQVVENLHGGKHG